MPKMRACAERNAKKWNQLQFQIWFDSVTSKKMKWFLGFSSFPRMLGRPMAEKTRILCFAFFSSFSCWLSFFKLFFVCHFLCIFVVTVVVRVLLPLLLSCSEHTHSHSQSLKMNVRHKRHRQKKSFFVCVWRRLMILWPTLPCSPGHRQCQWLLQQQQQAALTGDTL